jgi:sortase A
VSDERTIDVSEQPLPDSTRANTGGLATRFVGGGRSGRQPEPRQTTSPAVALKEASEDEAFPSDPETAPPRDGTRLLRAGLVASTAGLCLLLFVGYVYAFSGLQEHRSQRALLNQFTLTTRHTILSGRLPPQGDPVAVLDIPAIGLSQVVVYGTTATDLLKGPGLMPGTARPGSLGNSVIAGHRTIDGAPFAKLVDLRSGDRIEVVTGLGVFHYRVTAAGSARPGAPDPTSPDRHPRLTLVTSGGTAASNGRSYVVASLLNTPSAARVPRRPPTTAERGLTGDAQAVLPSVMWGIVLAAGFALTFWAYWRFRRNVWSVYILSTPVLLTITLLWYENLIRLLPGTM